MDDRLRPGPDRGGPGPGVADPGAEDDGGSTDLVIYRGIRLSNFRMVRPLETPPSPLGLIVARLLRPVVLGIDLACRYVDPYLFVVALIAAWLLWGSSP